MRQHSMSQKNIEKRAIQLIVDTIVERGATKKKTSSRNFQSRQHFLRATDICERAYGLKFSRDNSTENLNKIYTIVGQIKR